MHQRQPSTVSMRFQLRVVIANLANLIRDRGGHTFRGVKWLDGRHKVRQVRHFILQLRQVFIFIMSFYQLSLSYHEGFKRRDVSDLVFHLLTL